LNGIKLTVRLALTYSELTAQFWRRPPMPDITTATLAALAACSPKTVTKWAREHGIKRIGRDYLFTPEQVAAFLSRDRKPGRKPKDGGLSRSGEWRQKQKEKEAK